MTDPTPCPSCGSPAEAWEAFCEGCGAELTPTAAAPAPSSAEAPITLSVPVNGEQPLVVAQPRRCHECGGTVDADGYCEQCGVKAPKERDHFTEQPSGWVAGVCDRGIRHHRNEDAMALAATPEAPGTRSARAVLVVCDGVSASEDSDIASLAGARAARAVLDAQRPAGLGHGESQVQALTRTLADAVAVANEAVVTNTSPSSRNPASCTFAAAVVVDDLVIYGNVGDSRAYWIPDRGESQQLTVDDSVAQIRIEQGIPREVAEKGPQSHAITRWLGKDAPDLVPTSGSLRVEADGWLLVCSDGLWNYASSADEITTVMARVLVDDPQAYADPLTLADRMVRWACDQGGRDNVTVALARFGEPVTAPACDQNPAPDPTRQS